MIHAVLDWLAGAGGGLYKLCLAIGLLTLILSWKNTTINPSTFSDQDDGLAFRPVTSSSSPSASSSSSSSLPSGLASFPLSSSTSQTKADDGLLPSSSLPSINIGPNPLAPSLSIPSSSSSSSSPFNMVIPTEHRRLMTTALLVLDAPRKIYRANHPFHVGEHTIANIPTLAARSWPNQTHQVVDHVVVRLPSSQWAIDLRPMTRLVITLSILLAAQEAGVEKIGQIHFVNPVPGLKGATGMFDSWTVNLALQSPAEIFSVSWDEQAAAATAAERDAEEQQQEDKNNATAAAAAGASQQMQKKKMLTRANILIPSVPSSTITGLGGVPAGGSVLSSSSSSSSAVPSSSEAVTGGAAGGGPTAVIGLPSSPFSDANPMMSSPSMIKTTMMNLGNMVIDLGSFGRDAGPWQKAWYLNDHERGKRVRELAWSLCDVSPEQVAASRGGGGGGANTTTTTVVEGEEEYHRPLKVIIYNRDSTRQLRQDQYVAAQLHSRLPKGSRVKVVVHREDRPVCELANLLADADALITPHGFSSMLMLFLPPKAILVEIMPYQFNWPGYGALAAAFGVKHIRIGSEPVRKLQPVLLDMVAPLFLPGGDSQKCKEYALCRFVSKKFPVRLDDAEQLDRLAVKLQQGADDADHQGMISS